MGQIRREGAPLGEGEIGTCWTEDSCRRFDEKSKRRDAGSFCLKVQRRDLVRICVTETLDRGVNPLPIQTGHLERNNSDEYVISAVVAHYSFGVGLHGRSFVYIPDTGNLCTDPEDPPICADGCSRDGGLGESAIYSGPHAEHTDPFCFANRSGRALWSTVCGLQWSPGPSSCRCPTHGPIVLGSGSPPR